MTTLSPTQARTNLSSLLKRAAKGEDIGILHGDQVIALRPAVGSRRYDQQRTLGPARVRHSNYCGFRDIGIVEEEIELHEGTSHAGMSAVINFTAWK